MRRLQYATRPALRMGLIAACSAVLACLYAPVATASDTDAATGARVSSSDRGSTTSHQQVIPTRPGLRLLVRADCVDVRIVSDRSESVAFAVRQDGPTAAPGSRPSSHVTLRAHNTPQGVALVGPDDAVCRGNLSYEIHVPSRYDLDVAVHSGSIMTQDIDGVVTLSTGGGDIRAGNIGHGAPAGANFLARIETAGGDISVGNVAGGLRAATAGGGISAGDVHGPAVLRTGGGDICVGHVFGAARFVSGGGDIVAEKIDGGIWADTAGGRVEIGHEARMAAFAPAFPDSPMDSFAGDFSQMGAEEAQPYRGDLLHAGRVTRLFEAFLWGGVRVDPADQQQRLVHCLAPEYPDAARLAGIEGKITLRILVAQDGSVRGIVPVSGAPILIRAATRAVEHWRYAPAFINGRPVDVVTTVTLAFRLHP